jgi:hypothetical protein
LTLQQLEDEFVYFFTIPENSQHIPIFPERNSSMKTRMKVWCLVCGLCGAFAGATVSALYQDTGRSMLLGTGMGLVIGLTVGALLRFISPKGWAAIGEGVGFVAGFLELIGATLECCSVFGILFLSFSAMITTFIFGHHLWSSLLAGTSVMGLSIFALSLAVFIDRTRVRFSLKSKVSS